MKIRDVAKAAGVSIATVSRVINHPEKVTAETRDRVQAIIEHNRYVPNEESKLPRRGRKKNIIALIVSDLSLYRNLIGGVRTICEKKNYSLQICEVGDNEKMLQTSFKSRIAQQADGLLLAEELLNSGTYKMMQEAKIPFVCVGGEHSALDVNLCYINYRDAAAHMAQILSGKPDANATLVLLKNKSCCAQQLKDGFCNAWMGQVHVEYVDNTPDSGYLLTQELLGRDTIPGVILAQTDEIAVGILKAAKEAGISVPQELRVAGFDNSPFSAYITPELTSVEQPTYRLGLVATRMLFDILEDEEFFDVEVQEVALKGHLKIRQSCGNKKAIYQEYE